MCIHIEQVKYKDAEEKENVKPKGQKRSSLEKENATPKEKTRSTQVFTPEFEVLYLY